MAMAKKRIWGLLTLMASFPLAVAQMSHDIGDHSMAASPPSTTTSSSSRSTETHLVQVGYQNRSFFPNNTKARVGDTVEFQFLPGLKHSVVRAEYMWPCIPYENVGNGRTGFFSGFFTVGKNDAIPKWRTTIMGNDPIYFYSSADDDCNRYGMVGSINAKSMSELEHQADMALDSTKVEQPLAAKDEPMNTSSTTSPTTTSSETATLPTPPPASPATETPPSAGLAAGGIAGVVVGAVAGIALIAGLFYWYGIMRARQTPPKTSPETSPMAQSSYLSPSGNGGPPSSFDARSTTMFSSNGVPSPPPQTHLGAEQPFVDGDTIYVPVKRSTMIASGDMSHLPAELYNPAELYRPGVPGQQQNSDTASWHRGFEQQADASSLHQHHHHQTPPPVALPSVNHRPSELSG